MALSEEAPPLILLAPVQLDGYLDAEQLKPDGFDGVCSGLSVPGLFL